MDSKWADQKSGEAGETSPRVRDPSPSSSSQRKDGAASTGRRPRRPRAGDRQSSIDANGNPIERPPIKTMEGGWGFGGNPGSTSSEAQSKTVASVEGMEAKMGIDGSSARPTRRNHFDNDETEILVIPDLEDDGEEDIITKVAVAPKNTSRRVPSLRELDEDLKYSVPSAADGLDMSLLTKTLVPPEMLDEDDSVWDFDGLLQAVTQEFNAQARTESENNGSEAAKNLPQPTWARSALGSRVNRALVA